MHIFENDTAINQKNENTFEINITENWNINKTANGGYLLAMITRVLEHFSTKKSTPIITANFMTRCTQGPAEIKIATIHESRQFHRISASIIQDKIERVRACGTFVDPAGENHETILETGPPELENIDQCVLIPSIPNYSLYDQMDIYLDPSCAGWFKNELAEISMHKGWIKFKDNRPHDLASIALFTDAFPPPVMASQGIVAWVPTIEFSYNVRTIPETEWCKGIFRTRFITNGICEEDGELWDESGNLVAISRQISLFTKNS